MQDQIITERNVHPTIDSAIKHSKRIRWTLEENNRLRDLVNRFGERKWTIIAAQWTIIASGLKTRTRQQCHWRWKHHLRPGLNKMVLSQEEWDRAVNVL